MRLLLYLRLNQARISIYRPTLNSATSILSSFPNASTVVDVARDTISLLTKINQITDIYRPQQVCYNYFLVQSLAVILLAVAHVPAEFVGKTRDEFYAALNLVKGFSTKSYIFKKLWQTIRELREVGEKIGLLVRNGQSASGHLCEVGDAHSNAAVGLAGLSGHPVDEFAMFNGGLRNLASESDTSPLDSQQLSRELTNLFELAAGYTNSVRSPPSGEVLNGVVSGNSDGQAVAGGMGNIFRNEEEFSRIIGVLF